MLGITAWQLGKAVAIGVSVLVAFLIFQLGYLYGVLVWGDIKTRGLSYFGLPRDKRGRFKRAMYWHSVALSPILWLLGKTSRFAFHNATFTCQGITGPKGTCSVESFQRALEYQPRPEDVFVVTQMKCGTTWMQHVVYQVLTRGGGNLAETGTSLYAVSPWLESLKSVSVDDAPLTGAERPSRLIKTHLPSDACPYSADAKYVYVTRHPAACFASCIDFVTTNIGGFVPPLEDFEAWFRSNELMWWGTWPSHVQGWWELSQQRSNVLFVRFEDMKANLPAIVRQVAEFLRIEPLRDAEVAKIVSSCSFDYMREHVEVFEMNPPHVLQTKASFFVSGKTERHNDVPEVMRRRLLAWCKSEMARSAFPLAALYPDAAEANSQSACEVSAADVTDAPS